MPFYSQNFTRSFECDHCGAEVGSGSWFWVTMDDSDEELALCLECSSLSYEE